MVKESERVNQMCECELDANWMRTGSHAHTPIALMMGKHWIEF